MKILLSYLLEYDLFGVNLNFTFLKKEKHGSFFSLILSMVLVTICVSKLIIHSLNLIYKTNLDFKIIETSKPDDTIQLKNLNLEICYTESKLDFKNFRNITIFTRNQTIMNNTNNLIKDCKSKYEFFKCICLNYNDTFYDEIVSKNDLNNTINNVLYFELDFNKTNITKLNLFILTNKTYIDIKDYNEKFKYYEEYYSIQARPNRDSLIEFMIDKLIVESSNDIFSFGLFEASTTTFNNYTIGDHYYKSYTNEEINMGRLYILLRHSKVIKTFNIISFSIENLLSQLGGYIQIMTFIFTYVGEKYNIWSLNRVIGRRFEEKLKNFKKAHIKNNISMKINYTYKDSNYFNKNSSIVNEKGFELKTLSNRNINSIDPNEFLNYDPNTLIYSLIDEYYNTFDYENLYDIYKEVKLLKYILLNQNQKKLIETYKKYPIDFRNEKLFNEYELSAR